MPQKNSAHNKSAKSPTGKRAKPGSRAGGQFFHIEVRPARDFVRFRMQDIGGPGGVERLAGQRANGSWDTQKWLIEKSHAHLDNGTLVPDSLEAENVLKALGSPPVHVGGDRFKAKPRRDIPEAEKPTPAMRRAQLTNIKKAQAASRRKTVKKTKTVAKAAKRPAKSSTKSPAR